MITKKILKSKDKKIIKSNNFFVISLDEQNRVDLDVDKRE